MFAGKRNKRRRINRPSTWGFLWFFLHTKLSLPHKNWVLDWLFDCSVKWLSLIPVSNSLCKCKKKNIYHLVHMRNIYRCNLKLKYLRKNTVHLWRPHHFNIKLSFLKAAWSCWFLSGWNFAVPQQPVFERRSSRVTALCIADHSWNVSWAIKVNTAVELLVQESLCCFFSRKLVAVEHQSSTPIPVLKVSRRHRCCSSSKYQCCCWWNCCSINPHPPTSSQAHNPRHHSQRGLRPAYQRHLDSHFLKLPRNQCYHFVPNHNL